MDQDFVIPMSEANACPELAEGRNLSAAYTRFLAPLVGMTKYTLTRYQWKTIHEVIWPPLP